MFTYKITPLYPPTTVHSTPVLIATNSVGTLALGGYAQGNDMVIDSLGNQLLHILELNGTPLDGYVETKRSTGADICTVTTNSVIPPVVSNQIAYQMVTSYDANGNIIPQKQADGTVVNTLKMIPA